MSVPARRQSRTRTRNRRSHHGVTKVNTATCANCQAAILPHRICAACGHYGKVKAMDVERQKMRAIKRAEDKLRSRAPQAEEETPKKGAAAKPTAHDHDHDHDHDHAKNVDTKGKARTAKNRTTNK